MQNRTSIEQKTKGIIVCDTSGLMPLLAPIPIEALTKESYQKAVLPTVFDSLIFLAHHGYKIVVPEMIAHEMGEHMRDGENVRQYFTSPSTMPIVHATSHRAFFQEMAHLQNQGLPVCIQPPLPHDTSKEATFLNARYRIHRSHGSRAKKVAEFLRLEMPAKKDHAGDRQLKAYISGLDDSETPIYVLTLDRTLQHSFIAHDNVNAIGTTAFYEALKREGFLDKIGINSDVLDFAANCQEHFSKYNLAPALSSFAAQTDAKSGRNILMQKEPFAAAMKELAEEIAAPSPPANDHPTLTVEGGGEASKPMASQTAKFNARFGKK